MGSRYYIGKRDIGVCRRYCRDTHVFGDWGNSLFFAYPLWGGNLLFVIYYYLWFNAGVIADAEAWGNAARVIDHSVLTGLPYLTRH